jgi:hypothetical protein
MKKMLLSLAVTVIAAASFGQTTTTATTKPTINYRVGIATSLPVDVHGTAPRVGIGSTFLEASCNPYKAKKVTFTASAGYFRIVSGENTPSYSQIPVMVGARYSVNQTMYFGAALGTAFYTKKGQADPDFAFSPYVGFQSRRISVDARYFNFWKQPGSSLRSVGLVFSYTL